MEDYQARLVVEYEQLRDRTKKLEKFLRKISVGKSDIELNCPLHLLQEQHNSMVKYLDCLKRRAIMEDIDLEY